MNIFLTDPSPMQCARDLDDKRVVNQTRETGQLLCTALEMNGVDAEALPMRPTHRGHPVTKWVAHSLENWLWTYAHFRALADEKHRRYPHRPWHATWLKCQAFEIYECALVSMPRRGRSPFVNFAKNDSKGLNFTHVQDVHAAYRLYMAERWTTDARVPKWTGNTSPAWLSGKTLATIIQEPA